MAMATQCTPCQQNGHIPTKEHERGSCGHEGPSGPSGRDDIVWGKTPSGDVFRVPATHDVLTALFHPSHPKSHFDLLSLGLLGMQLLLFFWLPRGVSKRFFFFYFAFWRTAYDAGLGWVLTKQSKKTWIVKEVQRLGWLDANRRPVVKAWIRSQLAGKMGKDYSFDDLPLEYNTWLLFRQVVDIILLNDFLAYCMFAFSCFRIPEGLSLPVHIMRWMGGVALIAFNLWVKVEAHNVVKLIRISEGYYGWFWGDAFFQRGALIFDGVFELAPHPMYSVGYAGYYGLSLISGSYPVLFVSLAAHAAQFGFLLLFENPHIERMYGQRKPIAQRTPLFPPSSRRISRQPSRSSSVLATSFTSPSSTPAETEGETATETELYTDTEIAAKCTQRLRKRITRPNSPASSTKSYRPKAVSHHDLHHKYFRSDTLILRNIDLFRAPDFMLALILFYALVFSFLPHLSQQANLALHFAHALVWCIFHCFGLGFLLRAQSERKFIVRHFVKHYHYPPNDGGAGALQEAFTNWKSIYNLSLCMTYVSFIGVVWKQYSFPDVWAVGHDLLRHTLGVLLVCVHIWSSVESFEVIGVFGWFFGDFFMEDYPAHLDYTGIYRYVNNPDVLGAASWFGLALLSGSKLVAVLAVIRHMSQWWFLSNVENPHMRKLYGESLRKDAGFVKVIKTVASKNVRLLESRAGRHAPEIRRVANEVIGTFDKVYEETADAVEEFWAKSRPKISEVVQDTKALLQQSRERLFITPIANDISLYDTAKYKISVVPSDSTQSLRFHLGEPIRVNWHAPHSHSPRDWMGIYRVGANKSTVITKTSSLGMWAPAHGEEWDGDFPLGLFDRQAPSATSSEDGQVTFRGDALPWSVGRYEVRYHHDGKYNVMSIDGAFEIYVERATAFDFASVRDTLMHIVPLCLDSDPSLIPLSCQPSLPDTAIPSAEDDRDPDDFRFWSARQAKRICVAIKEVFGVDYVPEVIVADANLSALANRIVLSKEILTG